MGERPEWEVGEAPRLLGGRLGELGAAVPDLHREQAGQTIEVATAVHVEHVAALAVVDDRHVPVGSVRGQPGEVHPQMALRAGGKAVGFVGHGGTVQDPVGGGAIAERPTDHRPRVRRCSGELGVSFW